jgi:Flp pilus assembly protein TadG
MIAGKFLLSPWGRLKRLWRREEGTSALEFALVAPVLITTVVGIMEISMILIVSALIEGGLRDAARFGITGYVPQGTTREDKIKSIIADATIGLVDMSQIDMQTLVYPSFADIGKPEPYTDTNGNGQYDLGEPYTDINGNGQWDADMGAAGLGGPGEVVLYKVKYKLPTLTMLLTPFIGGEDGKINLSASIAVRNEPYPTNTGTTGGST